MSMMAESKPPSKVIIIAVLALIAFASLFFFVTNGKDAQPPILDDRLVGTWLSTDYVGYRVIFLFSGEFVVTSYGRPSLTVNRWQAQNGHLRLNVNDDDCGERVERDVTYSLSPDGKRLTVSHDAFGVNAKHFVRAMAKP